MSEWPMVPLRKIAVPISRDLEVKPGNDYRTIGVRWWGEGAYERKKIDGSETQAKKLTLVKSNDLIINKIWVRHGSTAIAGNEVDGCVASNEFPTFELDREQITPRWMHWISKTQMFWRHCDALSMGTSGKNRIKPEKFLTIEIPLPPLSEQQRIVEWIDALASLIEVAKDLRVQSEEMRHRLVSSLHTSLSDVGVHPLSDYLELDEDRVPIVSNGEYPQIGLRGFGGGMFYRETLRGDQTKYKHFNRLYEGAVVLSQVKGWEGAIAVASAEFDGNFSSPEYRTFRCKEAVIPEYLATLIPSPWFWKQLAGPTRGVGARRERIRPEAFLKLKIKMPKVEDQEEAIKVFREIKRIHTLDQKVPEQLNAIIPSVLNDVFSGGSR